MPVCVCVCVWGQKEKEKKQEKVINRCLCKGAGGEVHRGDVTVEQENGFF